MIYSCYMELRLEVPDVLAQALGPDPARAALEAMLAQLVYEGAISIGFAGDVLGLRSDDALAWYRERGHTPRPMSDEQITSGVKHWADRERDRPSG